MLLVFICYLFTVECKKKKIMEKSYMHIEENGKQVQYMQCLHISYHLP